MRQYPAGECKKPALTETSLSQINSNLEHRESSSQRLRPSTKRTNPSLILEVRMQRSTTFVPDEMSKEATGFISPMRDSPVGMRSREHDGVDRYEFLYTGGLVTRVRIKFNLTHTCLVRTKGMIMDDRQRILSAVQDGKKKGRYQI